jgi:hypothetical protein
LKELHRFELETAMTAADKPHLGCEQLLNMRCSFSHKCQSCMQKLSHGILQQQPMQGIADSSRRK